MSVLLLITSTQMSSQSLFIYSLFVIDTYLALLCIVPFKFTYGIYVFLLAVRRGKVA